MSSNLNQSRWVRVRLADVAQVRTGLAKNSKKPDDAICLPYLRVANVQDGHLDLSEVKQIEISRREIDRYSLAPGDVLLTEGGDFDKLGRGYVWNGEIAPCLHQNHIFAVRPNPRLIDPHFLAYFAASPVGRDYFLRCSKRSTNLASINSNQLKATPILLPPITEQRRIVRAVRVWEIALSHVGTLISAKDQLRRTLTNRLLTSKSRFFGFNHDWREKRLSQLFVERSEIGYEQLPLLAVTASNGVVLRNSLDRRDTSADDKSKYLRVNPGDIVYNTMRMWQGVSGLSVFEGIVSPAYTVCTPTHEIEGRFAARLFKLPEIVHRFYQHSQGLVSDTWNLKFPHFAAIRVRIPDVDEQKRIADVLDLIDREIQLLRRQRELLEKQKRAVIHKLVSGEIRLEGNE